MVPAIGTVVGALFCRADQTSDRVVIRVSEDLVTDFYGLSGALVHEWVHVLAHEQGLNLEPWLEEGLAGYLQSRLNPSSLRNILRTYLSQPKVVPLGLAKEALARLDEENLRAFYGGTYGFIKYLVDNYGEQVIPAILSQNTLNSRLRVSKAVSEVTGVSYSFQELWRNFSVARFVNEYDYFGPDETYLRYMIDEDVLVSVVPVNVQELPTPLAAVPLTGEIGSVSRGHEVVWIVRSQIGRIEVVKDASVLNPPKGAQALLIRYE